MHSYLSKAIHHYPQIKIQQGKRVLWNPILKKGFVNRPEERVRLQLVEYLIREAGFSSSKFSFESPVKIAFEANKSRTDIILYDQKYKPLLLVECKARDIRLDEKAAKQVARYFQEVKAPFILLSNGIFDYWFDMGSTGESSLMPLKEIPGIFQAEKEAERDINYWKERGFAGGSLTSEQQALIAEICSHLYNRPQHHVLFLPFEDIRNDFSMDNYYAVFQEGGVKVAIAFSATIEGDTRLNVILNKSGVNEAYFSTSFLKFFKNESEDTELYFSEGVRSVNLTKETGFIAGANVADFITAFKQLLLQKS